MESAKQATPTSRIESANRVESPNRIESQTPFSAHTATHRAQAPASASAPGRTAGPLPIPSQDLTDKEKAIEILKTAGDAFAATGNWVVFYRDVLGANGIAQRTFDTEAKFEQFQKTPQYAELQEMVAALRSQDTSKGDAVELEKMITIRLPESLHKVLTDEAESMNLSINKLCISKLLQPVEGRFVPVQQGRRRGRRPGPQGSRKKNSIGTS
jgi:predicted HicB family RNase H-like nuclease